MTGAIVVRCGLVAAAFGYFWISGPVAAIELTAAQAALYTTVSIFPPSATSMTVCYSFVCRRREMLDFTPADRRALSKILGTGRSSAAAERAAVQKAVIWFDRRMGPIIGTDKRVVMPISVHATTSTISIAGTPPAIRQACYSSYKSGAFSNITLSAIHITAAMHWSCSCPTIRRYWSTEQPKPNGS